MVPPSEASRGKIRQTLVATASSCLRLTLEAEADGRTHANSATRSKQLFGQGDKADALTARGAFVRLRDALGDGHGARRRARRAAAHRLARERVGEEGHPARVPVRPAGRRVDGPRQWPFFDKDTMPIKTLALDRQVRLVPGGSAVREGAFIGRGVICMPPMYINIGAYVGECTLVD